MLGYFIVFFFQAEDGIRDIGVTGVQTCALPISLLDRLNFLVRSDCTTRNVFKARQLAGYSDELEERIARLEAEEELASIRPPLDGRQVMDLLGIKPGPLVGKALSHMLELRLDRGPMAEEEAVEELRAWAREQGLGSG